ncbi:hypothetical protein HDU86_006992 [Geranomyces michiganensis]|nr:hypothetical protein HDU86_006992 [Geranomyces michiganensis]
MEFPSHTEAARLCGTVVDEIEVPIDDPARRIPVKAAAFEKPTNFIWGQAHIPSSEDSEEVQQSTTLIAQVKERPKIKVYEESVDMSMDEEPSRMPVPIPLSPLTEEVLSDTPSSLLHLNATPDGPIVPGEALPSDEQVQREESLSNLRRSGDAMELDALDEAEIRHFKSEADAGHKCSGVSQYGDYLGRAQSLQELTTETWVA